jgi:hypothetical protein
MATPKSPTNAEVEAQIANAVAGHKTAGFDVTEADREMLRARRRGEITTEQIIEEIKAANAATRRLR